MGCNVLICQHLRTENKVFIEVTFATFTELTLSKLLFLWQQEPATTEGKTFKHVLRKTS